MKAAALSFSSISTPSPHHSRSLPLPLHFTLAVLSRSPSPRSSSLTLSVIPPLGLTSLTLSAVSSLPVEQPPPPPTSPRYNSGGNFDLCGIYSSWTG
ncbi:hypothetical protein Sjap_014380 [Stephania japonica]|uniref:Uncharacterized protein n=1 Tax=Stephania japonica TaxID=461633 RepID=A0AAP0NZL2_9MAGN